jgi:hypothetical protein
VRYDIHSYMYVVRRQRVKRCIGMQFEKNPVTFRKNKMLLSSGQKKGNAEQILCFLFYFYARN